MGKSTLVRPSFLSCFSCGLAGLPGDGSVDAGTKRNGDAPNITPAPILRENDANGASPFGGNIGSRPATAESRARRPSTAFNEPAPAGPLLGEAQPTRKLGVASAADGEDAGGPPAGPAVSTGTPPPYLITAGGAAATVAVSTLSGSDAFPSRRQQHQPRVRTSRVSPAYDTEDELSPAVLSRSPSGSDDDSSFPSYAPSLEEEPLQGADGDADAESDGAETNGVTTLVRGRGPVTDSREATGDGGSFGGGDAASLFGAGLWQMTVPEAEAVGGRQCSGRDSQVVAAEAEVEETAEDGAGEQLPAFPGAQGGAVPHPPTAAAAMAAAAAGSGRGSRVPSPASSPSATPTAAVTAPDVAAARRISVGSASSSSRNTSAASRTTATAASRRTSAAERPGTAPGGGGAAAAATAAGGLPFAGADVDDDDDDSPRADGGGGGAAAAAAATARRGSFAGDSSTSLVGPASVSTAPQMRNCPSLRPTTRGSTPPQSPPPAQPQELPAPALVPCESLRLSPFPQPLPPPALQSCGSLRLSPLSPSRLMAPSPSLRPTPLLPPSPSLDRRPPSQDLDLLVLLPGAQASETSPATHGSADPWDQMLRLGPQPTQPQQPPRLLQHSPCSIGRSAFPRANTLAPLPVENTAALNRLASMQAAFRERQQQGLQDPQGPQPVEEAAEAAMLQASDDGGGDGDEDWAARGYMAEGPGSSPVPLWLEPKSHGPARELRGASWERGGGAAAAAMAAAAADAAAAAAKPASVATAAAAGFGADEYDEYEDDVASMVSHLLPPPCFRSSAPAVPYGGGAALSAVTKEQHVLRTGSLEHPGPATTAKAADAAQVKCTAPLSDPGVSAPPPAPPAAGLVSEPPLGSDPASLGTHAAKWLEELLPPPSPGYRSTYGPAGRSGVGLAAAAPAASRRPAALPAADSFKCLMREID